MENTNINWINKDFEIKDEYTTKDICEIMDIYPNLLRYHLQSKNLKAKKIYDRWIVSHSDLMDFIKKYENNEFHWGRPPKKQKNLQVALKVQKD